MTCPPVPTDCDDCVPEIKFFCSDHRPENLCVGCLKTDQKLIGTAIGIICKTCARREGMIFV